MNQSKLIVHPTVDQKAYESALAAMIRLGERLAQESRERKSAA